MATGKVPAGSTEIFYIDAGEGAAVLFIHAAVADSRMWRHQMTLDGFRSVTFDQRGFGQTAWVPEPYANRWDAVAVLDHLDVASAVVVGCSNGGEAALQLAIETPERVSGLVLVGAAPRGWEPSGGWIDQPLEEEAIAAFGGGDFDRAVDLEAQLWLAGPGRSLDEVDPGVVSLFKEMDLIPQHTESERSQYVQTLEPPTNQRLDEISVPALVVVGEHDLPELIDSAQYLAATLSDRPAVVLANTAHLPSLEQPEAFNEALIRFLSAI